MEQYFTIQDGALMWDTAGHPLPHYDNIEMSGRGCSFIAGYGADENGIARFTRYVVFPTLRLIPNDTHASHRYAVPDNAVPRVICGGGEVSERAQYFWFDGALHSFSDCGGLTLERCFYPCASIRCAAERITLTNISEEELCVELSRPNTAVHSYTRGTKGVYVNEIRHTASPSTLAPGKSATFYVFYLSRTADEDMATPDGALELERRMERVSQLTSPLALDTGNKYLDTMFRYAKLRAGESIFDTLTGPLHSPGGGSYYAASWCNDEIEYAGPWFSYTGDALANEAAMHAYRQYMPFMAANYERIPSSVIAEGLDIWEGAGDRGDAAMYLWGGSLYALTCGDISSARSLWGALKWCAEYIERKKLPEGVISSDSDELEGRFPTDGKANLSTSCLAYAGLRCAARLAGEFGEADTAALYEKRAHELACAVERYFGAELHGFHVYRYSAGHDTLRAWICLPLCVGIDVDENICSYETENNCADGNVNVCSHDAEDISSHNDANICSDNTEQAHCDGDYRADSGCRADAVVDALLSDYMQCENGLLSCELGEENRNATIWDRALLYAYRAMFARGYGDRIFDSLIGYCKIRLTSERVPYAVEAYPEGDMRHLSGESALFCRMITEGLLAMEPVGLHSFTFTPRLTGGLHHIHLEHIKAFGDDFSIYVDEDGWRVKRGEKVISSGENGEKVRITL